MNLLKIRNSQLFDRGYPFQTCYFWEKKLVLFFGKDTFKIILKIPKNNKMHFFVFFDSWTKFCTVFTSLFFDVFFIFSRKHLSKKAFYTKHNIFSRNIIYILERVNPINKYWILKIYIVLPFRNCEVNEFFNNLGILNFLIAVTLSKLAII